MIRNYICLSKGCLLQQDLGKDDVDIHQKHIKNNTLFLFPINFLVHVLVVSIG